VYTEMHLAQRVGEYLAVLGVFLLLDLDGASAGLAAENGGDVGVARKEECPRVSLPSALPG
jgi:hypothetical protein